MHCGETMQSQFSCFYKQARLIDYAFIKRIRRKYLSYFKFRLIWKRKHITCYNKLLYKCPKCLKSFVKERILDYHVKSCWLNDGKSNSYIDFVTHMKVHGNEVIHMCPFCGQYFISLMALKKHERWHKGMQLSSRHKGRQLSSLTSTDQFSREAESRNHVQAPSKEFYCPYCHKRFGSKSFVAHKEHNSEAIGRTLQCRLCGLYFLHRCQLIEHNREHKRLDKNLKNMVREKLQKWVVRPSGEYIYCRLCGKTYKILDAVISHLESHFKEFVDHKRLQNSASYSLPLNNKSWEKAALLQCIEEINPRKLPKNFFLVDSNNVKQNYTPLSNLKKERAFDDQLSVCQSDNNSYLEKYCQSSQGSVTYGKDVFHVVSNITKSKSSFEEPGKDVYNCSSSSESRVTKHFGNDGFSGTDKLIDSLMKNSQEISSTQKIPDYEIGTSLKTVDTNTCKRHSEESALLKNNRKEVPLKGNETTANIVSVTSTTTMKDMNVVVGKEYTDFNQARSERNYAWKSSERLCQSRDDSLKFKSEFLVCPACHLPFERQAIVSHISLHEKDSRFTCHDCGLSFWCQASLKNHRLSNHPEAEAEGHSGETVKVASYKKEIKYVGKLKKKNEVNINRDGIKYNCISYGFDCSSWGDFLNHIFQEKAGEFCSLEQNTSNLNEDQKFLCQGSLKNHRLSNHPEAEAGGHSGETVKVASYKKEMKYVANLKKKNEVNINRDGIKYNCISCGFDCSSWGDFLNHIFQEKAGEFCCLEQNTSNLNEDQKFILKRTHEEHVHNEKMFISKWRKYFGINREVKVFLERIVPCKTCAEYYGITKEDRPKHQVVHKKS